MTDPEFQHELKALIEAYPGTPPGKNWPMQRVEAFYHAFHKVPHYTFRKACAAYIGARFNPPGVPELREYVDQFSMDETSSKRLSAEEFDRLHPLQPNAKEMADHYVPIIRELLLRGAGLPLPYDPKERINQ